MLTALIITLSWLTPLLNIDGSPCTDLKEYRIYKRTIGTAYKLIATTAKTTIEVRRLRAQVRYIFQVSAIDFSGNESKRSKRVELK